MSEIAKSYYYIMDYQSRYYKLDSKNQLVPARSRMEATQFEYQDAFAKVSGVVKKKFYFMTKVEDILFDKEEDKEILVESLAQEEDKKETDPFIEDREIIYSLDELINEENFLPPEKNTIDNNLEYMDWLAYLEHFTYISAHLNDYLAHINHQISLTDMKICDVLHYIELYQVDDAISNQLISLLQKLRDRRRFYKDERLYVEGYKVALGSGQIFKEVEKAIHNLQKLEKRRYKPREFNDLFKYGIDRKKVKEREVELFESVEEDKVIKEREEEMRELTWIETPFDCQEFDFMEFAKNQAIFYQYARQYKDNLQLEIEGIDEKIEHIMNESQSERCNVVQGFQYFKQIQDLRRKRTEKLSKWNMLYAMTESFDTEAMADEFEAIYSHLQERN